jgi:hypothetical protein
MAALDPAIYHGGGVTVVRTGRPFVMAGSSPIGVRINNGQTQKEKCSPSPCGRGLGEGLAGTLAPTNPSPHPPPAGEGEYPSPSPHPAYPDVHGVKPGHDEGAAGVNGAAVSRLRPATDRHQSRNRRSDSVAWHPQGP